MRACEELHIALAARLAEALNSHLTTPRLKGRFGGGASRPFAFLAVATPALRTIVYVDGFNLYYGAVKGTALKWLNLQRYFETILPKDDVVKIKYFTAWVKAPDLSRQQAFLAAVGTLPKVEVIHGLFKRVKRECKHTTCTIAPAKYKTHEEKRTDVNIAIHMLDDGYQGAAEHMVLVSGDSDLVPLLRLVRHRFPSVRITVAVPARDPNRAKGAVEIKSEADHAFVLPQHMLSYAQFPTVVKLPDGGVATKPEAWSHTTGAAPAADKNERPEAQEPPADSP